MNIIAPCPQKSSRYPYFFTEELVDEACQELRQILATSNKVTDGYSIVRTNNPMPYDSSFVVPNTHAASPVNEPRPRSFSMGNSRMFSAHHNDKPTDYLAY
ncbi:hypothetical protein BY458DRAFT_516782 [Sporodiniella umbellata]|nr:hypothetical protein BY458DRAFT_516782 [Sporodiniella umbellata]